jgi:hypothetical protein
MDDDSTHFIDNVLHGGDWSSTNTGMFYFLKLRLQPSPCI